MKHLHDFAFRLPLRIFVQWSPIASARVGNLFLIACEYAEALVRKRVFVYIYASTMSMKALLCSELSANLAQMCAYSCAQADVSVPLCELTCKYVEAHACERMSIEASVIICVEMCSSKRFSFACECAQARIRKLTLAGAEADLALDEE